MDYQETFLGLSTTTAFSIGFFLIIIYIVAQWKIYEKAGQPGWWLLLIIFFPPVGIVLAIWMVNLLSKSFGKDVLFTLGLLFFGIIFYPILGFGDAKYIGPAGK